jgi:formylmethanofuran dehydrogenase subunit E
MKAEEVLNRDDFKKCLEFHGHLCPGLAIGYRATLAGLDRLRESRSEDEEIVAIVENDACGTDAVQVLSGCTFGKGNFVYKDHGKPVFTFVSRASGRGIRVALKMDAFQPNERHMELIDKMRSESASDAEKEEFRSLHLQRSHDLLEKPLDAMFTIQEVDVELPQKARIERSRMCDQCGEPTMASKTVTRGDRCLCRDCVSES